MKKKTASNFGPKGWGVIIYGFLCFTVAGLLSNCMNVLYGYYGGVFGWERTSMAAFVSIANWVSILVILLCGAFGKKLGAKNMLIIGLIGSAAFFLYMSTIKTLTGFGIAYIGEFCFNAFITSFGIQYLGSNWFPQKKGLFMGWATMGVILAASAVNAVVVACMNSAIGVNLFFYISAGIMAAMLIYTFFGIHNYPEEVGAFPDNNTHFSREEQAKALAMGEEYRRTSKWTPLNILKDKNTWLIALGWGLMTLCMNGVFGQIVPAFASFGHGVQTGVNVLTYSFPVGFFFSWMGGWWDAKWGTRHASRWMCCGMNVLGCLLLGLLGQNLICAILGIWLFMGANSAGNNMVMSVVSSRYGRYDFVNGWTVISVMVRAISAAGAVITSAAADLAGGYKGAFLILLGITVLAFVFMSLASDKCVGRTEDEIAELMAKEGIGVEKTAE